MIDRLSMLALAVMLIIVLAFQQEQINRIGDDVATIKAFVIKTNDVVKYTQQDEECLAKNIYYEAGIENDNGKYAVAQVTLNRLATGKWGNDICSVVYSKAQFSWTLKRKLPKPTGTAWLDSKWVAHTVLAQGMRAPALSTATYYHADYVKPQWVKAVNKVRQVGTHIFYETI